MIMLLAKWRFSQKYDDVAKNKGHSVFFDEEMKMSKVCSNTDKSNKIGLNILKLVYQTMLQEYICHLFYSLWTNYRHIPVREYVNWKEIVKIQSNFENNENIAVFFETTVDWIHMCYVHCDSKQDKCIVAYMPN